MDYQKTRERVVTYTIPLIIGIVLGFLEVYGKEYVTPILLIGLAVLIMFVVFYSAVKFLETREKRWVGNKEKHTEFVEKIKKLEEDVKDILRNQKINAKINKLENQINYIEGRIKK